MNFVRPYFLCINGANLIHYICCICGFIPVWILKCLPLGPVRLLFCRWALAHMFYPAWLPLSFFVATSSSLSSSLCWHSIAAVCATGRKHDSIRHWTAGDCLPFNFHFVILIFLKLCLIIQIGPFMLNKKNEMLLLYDWFLIYTTLEIILLLFAAEWSDNNINLWGECWADSNVVWSTIPDESG